MILLNIAPAIITYIALNSALPFISLEAVFSVFLPSTIFTSLLVKPPKYTFAYAGWHKKIKNRNNLMHFMSF